MNRLLLFILVVALLATVAVARRFVVCDPPCQTGGHVPTCCDSHGYDYGYCIGGSAYCI